jgi:TolA-binding protein/outer membrane biosynthesis protein TonB
MKCNLGLAALILGTAVSLRAQDKDLPPPSLAQPQAASAPAQSAQPTAQPAQPSAPAAEAAPKTEAAAAPKPADASPAPKPVDASPAPKPAEPQAAPKPEPQPAPAPQPEPKAEPKAEPAPAPVVESKPAEKDKASGKSAKKEAKQFSPEEISSGEFLTLKSGAEDQNTELRNAALEDLRVFVQQHPDAEAAPEALSILAKQEEYRPAMVDWLHLVYEYPASNISRKAKSEYLDLVNKKMSSKLRPGLSALSKSPEAEDKVERLAALVFGLAEKSGDDLYEPAAAEIRRFQVRFPDYKDNDRILWSLAQLHLANGKNAAALMTYRELLSYQGSAYREKAQFATGELFSDKLKRYKEAVDAFQAFVEQYPESKQVLDALQRVAVLYADRLDQAPLAVETYERIIKLFPKTDGTLKAFNAEAKLQRDRLKAPADAISTYLRLTDQFRYPQAAEALMNAADVARKDLKDYKREVELRSKVAADFPLVKEAPEQLFEAAQVLEEDAQDLDGAVKLYQDVASKFPNTKQGKKAADRANKLLQKKG